MIFPGGYIKFLHKAGGIFTCFIFCLFVSSPYPLFAAAWILPKGDGQVITSLSFYHSDTFVSKHGHRSHQKTFTKWELNPYAEYGFSDKVTGGLSLHMPYVHQAGESSVALADMEVFVRQKLLEKKGWVVSWQPLVKLPGTYNQNSPLYGSKTWDAELRLLAGRPLPKNMFMNVETAYRTRLQSVSDEFRLDGTWGWHYTKEWMVLMQGFSTFAIENSQKAAIATTANSRDYDLIKWQGSIVKELSPEVSFQAGVMKDIRSRNTGKGEGVLAALWIRF